MMTATDRTRDLIAAPDENTFRLLREQKLLPETTTEKLWTPDDAPQQPSFAALAQLDPNKPSRRGARACRCPTRIPSTPMS